MMHKACLLNLLDMFKSKTLGKKYCQVKTVDVKSSWNWLF